jgi:hypothetical protein
MAARVAAQLQEETNLEVEIVSGGFREFAVSIDGHKAVKESRLRTPNPERVVAQVLTLVPET